VKSGIDVSRHSYSTGTSLNSAGPSGDLREVVVFRTLWISQIDLSDDFFFLLS
jgi:hypothetical protein